MSQERFETLTERLEAGLATEAEQRELAALLDADPQLRRGLVEQALSDVLLRKVLAGTAATPARPAAIPIWRVILGSAAAAVLLLAGGYVLWQLQTAPESVPPTQGTPLVVTSRTGEKPPVAAKPYWAAWKTGRLQVDGTEKTALHDGATISPAGDSAATIAIGLTDSELELAPGAAVTLRAPVQDGTRVVAMISGEITLRLAQADAGTVRVETPAGSIVASLASTPGVESKAACKISLSGTPGRPKLTVAVAAGQAVYTQAGAAAGTAASMTVLSAGERRSFKPKDHAGPRPADADENDDDEDDEEDDEDDDEPAEELRENGGLQDGRPAAPAGVPNEEF